MPSEPVPTQVIGVVSFAAISCGKSTSAAIDSFGFVWAWGSGIGPVPQQLVSLSGIVDVAAGGEDQGVLALMADGTVWRMDGWQAPAVQENLPPCASVAAVDDEWAVIDTLGNVWMTDGSGAGCTPASATWCKVDLLSNISEVVGSRNSQIQPIHALALQSDASVWGWGNNCCGQLGIGNDVLLQDPTPIRDFFVPPLGVYLAATPYPELGTPLRMRGFSDVSVHPMFVFGDTQLGAVPLGDPMGLLGFTQLAYSPDFVVVSDPTGILGPTLSYPYTDYYGSWNFYATIPNDSSLLGFSMFFEAYLLDANAGNGVFHQSNLVSVTIH